MLTDNPDKLTIKAPMVAVVSAKQDRRFLALRNDLKAMVDLNERYLTPVDELLGILVTLTAGK